MILIIGASGRLGGLVARKLLAKGQPVRAMSRTPQSLAELLVLGAEVVQGDQRDPKSLASACKGVETLFTASHAFGGSGDNSPRVVDGVGNRAVFDAARTAGVAHVTFTSIMGARPNHPVDLYRYKYASEQYLRESGITYTILRPSVFMETWAHILGDPIVSQGRAMVFGRGKNPINFVSVEDVATLAVNTLADPRTQGNVIEIGGPENVTETRFVEMIQQATGRVGKIQHIPLPMMRLMGVIARPFSPAFSRQSIGGVVMDTEDMTFDPSATLALYPMRLRHLQDVIREQFAGAAVAHEQPA